MMLRHAHRGTGLALMALFLVACRHDWSKATEFASAIRCGMSESEIRRVAKEQFGVPADHIWQQHSSNVFTVKARELDFVDILLQSDGAVAVQRGNYVSFTTGVEFGEIRMLCGAEPISESQLRDYDPR